MDHKTSAFLLIFLAPLLTINSGRAADLYAQQTPGDSTYNHLYEKGMKIVNDHPTQALNIWLSAKNFGKAHDPRIGIHFVETVTKQKMKRFYDQASAMYFWGMNGTETIPYRDELLDELKRLQPLMSDGRYKKLRVLLDDNDPRFYKKLRLFWQEHDPLPSTPKNEYLLTVWERIAFARKNFTKGHYSAYGTDARGPVYVEFGRPDNHYQNREIDLNIKSKDIGNAFNVSKTSASVQRLFRLNPESPNILFWIYNKEKVHANRRVIYMFGTIPKKQPRYDIIESLDQFIPDKLNRNPGAYHEAVIGFRKRIYREYQSIAPFFHKEYVLIDFKGNGNTRSYADMSKARTTSVLEARKHEAKPVTRPGDIPDFKSKVKTYQFFDGAGRAYFVAVIYSFPEKLLAANKYNEAISGVDSKKVINHTLQVIGPDEDSLQTFQNVPEMELSSSVIGDRAFPVVSIFELPHEPSGARLRGTAELISYDKNKHGSNKISFIGLHDGDQKLGKIDRPDENKWFISDPVLGYQKESVKLKDNPFSFYPAPEHIIPQGKNINLYFELYDFGPTSDRRRPYRISYSVRHKKGVLGSIFGGNNDQKVTIKQQKSSSVEPNRIEIKTSSLTTGDYKLHVEIEHPKTGRIIKRNIEFEVK